VSVVIAADRFDRSDDAVFERVHRGALVLAAEVAARKREMDDDGVLGGRRR
jgi:hypothetical protein